MISGLCQRWRGGRERYRPAGETIRPAEYAVAEVARPDARAFVGAHHYAASLPSNVLRYGLFRRGALAGVAVFGNPAGPAVMARAFEPAAAADALELNRLVLLDEVPGNGESWFIARCFAALRREGVAGVLAFSDPAERTDAEGRRVKPGHLGIVYQATNAAYLGRSTARTLRLLPDGTVYSERAASKVRAGDSRWRSAAAPLVRFGAPAPSPASLREWLAEWLPRLTRPLAHPGNHRYAWALARGVRLAGRPGPYPKAPAA